MANEWLRYVNQNATRSQPLDPKLVGALSFLRNMGVTAEVFSGGQDAEGPNRTGSHRHDHGGAGDMRFYKDGRMLDWASEADRPVFEQIVQQGKANGVTGFGAGPGYMQPGSMHIGFGTPAVWGAGGKSNNAPDWLRRSFSGTQQPTKIASTPQNQQQTDVPAQVMGSMMAGSPPPQAMPQQQQASGPIPAAAQALANPQASANNIFGMMAAQPQQQAQFSPVQIAGPSPDQANALSSLIAALKNRMA